MISPSEHIQWIQCLLCHEFIFCDPTGLMIEQFESTDLTISPVFIFTRSSSTNEEISGLRS
jgi:hypothetical protein